MKTIKKVTYTSTDWHNWREGMTYIDNGADFTGKEDEILARIAQDIVDTHHLKDMTALHVRSAVTSGETYKEDPLHGDTSDGASSFLVETDETGCVHVCESGVYNFSQWYDVVDIPDANVRFYPAIEFQCLPKTAPRVTRLLTDAPYQTREEAEKFNAGMMAYHYAELHNGPAADIVPIVILVDETKYRDDPFFKKEMEARRAPNFWQTFRQYRQPRVK